jgi:hypothetical protein
LRWWLLATWMVISMVVSSLIKQKKMTYNCAAEVGAPPSAAPSGWCGTDVTRQCDIFVTGTKMGDR